MRWSVAGDDGEKKGGREEMGTADSAGKRKEGSVDVDGEHIQPNLARAMIEVKDYRCAVEAGHFANQKQHDIPCLLVYVSFQRGHMPNLGAETLPNGVPAPPTEPAKHKSHPLPASKPRGA